jgi:hypothetical protein
LRATEKEWIAQTLNKLPFVNWDRASFLVPPHIRKNRERGFWLVVFGWIEREDAYKDFIVVDFEIGEHGKLAGVLSCSSKQYSEEATKTIMGEKVQHNSCFRAENIGGILNCVKIGKS